MGMIDEHHQQRAEGNQCPLFIISGSGFAASRLCVIIPGTWPLDKKIADRKIGKTSIFLSTHIPVDGNF
jgi:hypothetical protein